MNSGNNLKVSIITVCYNAEKHIEQAIQSVLAQTYKNIEYIIVDGQSTDSTMTIINKYRNHITKIVSEKDSGIYAAMNKGIKLSQADILYFLNSDDRLYDCHVLDNIISAFNRDKSVDLIYGKVEFTEVPSELFLTLKRNNFQYKNKLSLFLKSVNPQQCWFSKRNIFEKIGLFDASYKICSDYDWFLRCAKGGMKMMYLDQYIAYVSFQGRSFTQRYNVINEKIKAVYNNSSLIEFFIYFIYASFRKMIHIFLEHFITPLMMQIKRKDNKNQKPGPKNSF